MDSGETKIMCRRAEHSDIPKIARMIRCRTLELFDDVTHPGVIFEKACLAVVRENEALEIVSAMFLCNYPNVPVLLQADWPTWMNRLYGLENATAANTLFVHFLVWDDRYERDFLGELLTATFYEAAFCDYVVLVLPAGIEPANAIREEMTKVSPKNEPQEVKAQVLYVSHQSKRIPRLKYRLAVEEDNDDVIQMLDAESTRLRELYGEFYISEMVRQPLESRRIIVSERENSSISAILCLNRNVDLDLLNDKFDLEPFAQLRKIRSRCSDIFSFDEYGGEYAVDAASDSLSISCESRGRSDEDLGVEASDSKSEENELCEDEDNEEYEADAFALELHGTQQPVDELRCQGLLSAGFECFPDLDYCVLLVPTDTPHFPMLDYFVRVPSKPTRDFPMALYVTHRSVLQADLRAREALSTDRGAIADLVEGMSNVVRDFDEALMSERKERRCFVFTCDEVVVGLAIVCVEEEVDRLRLCYRVEDLSPRLENANLDCCSGRLLRFELMPIFNSRLDFFLAEIMRLAGFQALYRRQCSRDDCRAVLPSCLSVMQPTEPRIRKFPHFQRFHEKENVDFLFDELFSLFVITPRLTMIRREIVNTKIVVVGASDCGLAFIGALTSGYKYRDLQFSDITLISSNGLPYDHSNDYSVRIMTPFRGRYCHAYRKLTSGNFTVIKGTVVAIDREKKRVQIENSVSVTYDYLVLTCGSLFQRPELDDSSLETPANCFLINDDANARNCLMEIRRMTVDFTVKQSIVFYGCNIECYCALAAFLELGLEGSWITLIEPKLLARDDVFRDDLEIKESLRETLASNGVRVVSDCDVVDWTTIEGSGVVIKSLRLGRNEEIIDCDALLSFQNKRPCYETFLAISRAGLVFDGRLVIDAEFRTNDRWVFAAGTMTKYSRKLRISKLSPHAQYNRIEVGEKLAENLVSTIASDNKKDEGLRLGLPGHTFREPVVVSCLLPGGYRYLYVRKPGVLNTIEDLDKEVDARDDVFTSGSRTADTGYFRLRLNQFRTVECVTCFGKTDFDIQNMISLYGRHEAMLNDLKRRFLNSEIGDFFAYFNEPWAAALFSDDFDEFRRRPRCFCPDGTTDCKQILRNYLTQALTQANYEENSLVVLTQISESDRAALMSQCLEKSCYLQEIEDGLIEFLERHEDELPMYKTSRKERRILREIEDTPLVYRDNAECICQSSA
ncbi:cilia- and flagella-associated protein 61 isoform X2 [Nasonia vitripennis]|uniref:Cilia- and flagella-associated protein 61 N-terminal domain-containing protein n=1 Tax=Nasonia vitripennis TaxID=7425 RepID=A0A7M7QIM5_NASVI|nr:cilia- and flagella-associated protein 61 isoform X2 [Nasonia vitripennis]